MDSFQQLGVCEELASACTSLGWKAPTPIQSEAIPLALDGKDIIGLAQTGSGKTGAFAIPILQALLKSPRPFFACIICPTRELARQIAEQFEALGSGIGLTCATIIGGIDMISQAIALGRRPHIVVATPGRLVDHLSNTKGFNLQNLKYLVLDEADRILDSDYEDAVNQILENIPKERNTYLFSATMTNKVAKLQRACLRKPAKVVVSSKYSTVDTLKQELLFIPFDKKDFYLIYLLHEMAGSITMVFTRTCESTRRLALLLRNLGLAAIPISGQMSQEKRLGALTKFKSGERNILVCTDVASRGLDILNVDLVVNFDMPSNSKDYIHRVGRTARAGRAGRAILFASQYDIEQHCRLENALGKRLPSLVIQEDEVNMLKERVLEAQRLATMHMREQDAGKKKRHKLADADDDGYLAGRKLQKGRPFYVK